MFDEIIKYQNVLLLKFEPAYQPFHGEEELAKWLAKEAVQSEPDRCQIER